MLAPQSFGAIPIAGTAAVNSWCGKSHSFAGRSAIFCAGVAALTGQRHKAQDTAPRKGARRLTKSRPSPHGNKIALHRRVVWLHFGVILILGLGLCGRHRS